MSELDAILENASNNTAGVFSLSGDTLAVLFFALGLAQSPRVWLDYADEKLSDADLDTIQEMLDWANDELMREVHIKPVGDITMWLDVVPPSNHLKCDGGAYYAAEWPELFDLWGYRYGGSGTQFATPDLEDWSPMGAGGVVGLNDFAGSITHTLTTDQMPAHTHAPGSPHTNFFGFRSGGTNTAPAGTALGVMAATGATGGGLPHNNLHSVFGCNYIVYAGKQVT